MALAKQLFKKGLDDMLAERYESGCPALAKAYELSKKAGPLFTLAECEAKWGKRADALGHYRDFLELYVKLAPKERAKQAKRKKVATEQVAALESLVGRLTVVLPADVAEGAAVERDGEPFDAGKLGMAQVVDPGKYQFTLKLADGSSHDFSVTISAGGRQELVLEPPKAEPAAAPVAPSEGGDTADGDGSALRTTGLVVGGVGAAGVVLGAVMGGLAAGTKDDIDAQCVNRICTQDGKDAVDRGQTFGTISTVGFIAGGALLVGGVTMFLLAPSGGGDSGETAGLRLGTGLDLRGDLAVGDDGACLSLRGRW
jgi:hypothetical protein